MIFWILICGMTLVVGLAVLRPLLRPQPVFVSGADYDALIYKDQLHEIEREIQSGVLTPEDAQSAQIEISRRLLSTLEPSAPSHTASALPTRLSFIFIAVLMPILALSSYIYLGAPHLPSQPVDERRAQLSEKQDMQTIVARMEAHLAKNPQDGKGWDIISTVYTRFGQYDEAAKAYTRAIDLLGSSADRQSGLGEALTRIAGGLVTAQARAAFETALSLDPASARSRYFLAQAAQQDGRTQDAVQQLQDLVKISPPDAPWLPRVLADITRLSQNPPPVPVQASPGPSASDVQAAQSMSADDRKAMITGMVARLAEKLKSNPDDSEGWLRLIRAYAVLGEMEQAKASALDARQALQARPDAVRAIDELVKTLKP